jgi:nicotinic acid mononucleotide adenylyltransferase
LVEEVVCVVPGVYPHKAIEGAAMEERLEMLRRAGTGYRVATTSQGLFIDIARELRGENPDADFHFICGRDAAERIVNWDYGEPGAIDRILEEFALLVAARQGVYRAPATLAHRVRAVPLDERYGAISSTEVRRCIAEGAAWEHLVPEPIVDLVRSIYRKPTRT